MKLECIYILENEMFKEEIYLIDKCERNEVDYKVNKYNTESVPADYNIKYKLFVPKYEECLERLQKEIEEFKVDDGKKFYSCSIETILDKFKVFDDTLRKYLRTYTIMLKLLYKPISTDDSRKRMNAIGWGQEKSTVKKEVLKYNNIYIYRNNFMIGFGHIYLGTIEEINKKLLQIEQIVTREQVNFENELKKHGSGYVYILDNPAFKQDVFKIGCTSKSVDERMNELNNTSIPLPFGLRKKLFVPYYQYVESKIHEKLMQYRINPRREFFKCSIKDIEQAFISLFSEHIGYLWDINEVMRVTMKSKYACDDLGFLTNIINDYDLQDYQFNIIEMVKRIPNLHIKGKHVFYSSIPVTLGTRKSADIYLKNINNE